MWVAEPLVSSGVPVTIMPCIKGRIGVRLGEGVRRGASHANTLQSGRTCATPDRWMFLRSWSKGGACNRLPRARHVNSNPFGNGISRTSHYIVLEVVELNILNMIPGSMAVRQRKVHETEKSARARACKQLKTRQCNQSTVNMQHGKYCYSESSLSACYCR